MCFISVLSYTQLGIITEFKFRVTTRILSHLFSPFKDIQASSYRVILYYWILL